MNKEQFWSEYENACKVTSIGGELCKLVGGFFPIVIVVVSVGISTGFTAIGGPVIGLVGIGFAVVLALMGAPIAALGTIATETKRQTRLMALDIKYR
jgi:hypothetical protein